PLAPAWIAKGLRDLRALCAKSDSVSPPTRSHPSQSFQWSYHLPQGQENSHHYFNSHPRPKTIHSLSTSLKPRKRAILVTTLAKPTTPVRATPRKALLVLSHCYQRSPSMLSCFLCTVSQFDLLNAAWRLSFLLYFL